ncbi:MAG: response regulator transcription factor [Burkholderiales bacterium]
MRILIIEDNSDILANLYEFLEPAGYDLDSARDGLTGLARAAEEGYDAIVLDLMLPGLDGLTLCRRLRRELRKPTPVLMLTARDTMDDKLAGFDSGADDYLIKPFSLPELDARLKALVRRARGTQTDAVLSLGELRFDTSTFEVSRAGAKIELTPTGYKLLACLLRASPRILTKEVLEREVWGEQPPDSDALRTHIHALRQAVDKPFSGPMLRTVHGIGYRLVDKDAD